MMMMMMRVTIFLQRQCQAAKMKVTIRMKMRTTTILTNKSAHAESLPAQYQTAHQWCTTWKGIFYKSTQKTIPRHSLPRPRQHWRCQTWLLNLTVQDVAKWSAGHGFTSIFKDATTFPLEIVVGQPKERHPGPLLEHLEQKTCLCSSLTTPMTWPRLVLNILIRCHPQAMVLNPEPVLL